MTERDYALAEAYEREADENINEAEKKLAVARENNETAEALRGRNSNIVLTQRRTTTTTTAAPATTTTTPQPASNRSFFFIGIVIYVLCCCFIIIAGVSAALVATVL